MHSFSLPEPSDQQTPSAVPLLLVPEHGAQQPETLQPPVLWGQAAGPPDRIHPFTAEVRHFLNGNLVFFKIATDTTVHILLITKAYKYCRYARVGT